MPPDAQTIDCPKCGASLTPVGGRATCAFCGTVSTIPATSKLLDASLSPVSITSPIWLQAWGSAHRWLCTRTDEDLVVLPFTDPYDDDRCLQCTHVALADRLAVETRVSVGAMVGTRPDGAPAVWDFTGPLLDDEKAKAWVARFRVPPIALVWGEFGPYGSQRIQLRVRAPAIGEPAQVLDTTVPIAAVADTVLDWLAAQGRLTRAPLPGWYRPPPASVREGYQHAIQGMLSFLLAKFDMTSLDHAACARYIEAAFNLASLLDAPPQCRLFPLSLAILAAEKGFLDAGHRTRALDVLRAATAPGDLLTWLAPRALRVLGAAEEADARAASIESAPDLSTEYRAWLDSLAKP